MKAWMIFGLPLLLLLAACTAEAPGSSDRQGVYFLELGGNVLDGTSATHADGNTTPVNVAFGTEYVLFVQCSGEVDVDALTYWHSPDRSTWVSGATTLAGCRSAGPLNYTLVDAGVHWLKFNVDINSSNATGALDLILSAK